MSGASFFDGLDRDGRTLLGVPVCVGPHGRLATSGLRVALWPVPVEHRATRHGLATVTEVWATGDAAKLASSFIEAVVVVDMMCAAELVSIRQLRRSGLRFAPGVLDAASEHALSPNEVRCRLRCRVALPGVRWLVNCPIFDFSGRLLGIADLLDLEAGLVVEFDGAEHRGAVRHTQDVVKEDALRRAGLEVVRVTGAPRSTRSRSWWTGCGRAMHEPGSSRHLSGAGWLGPSRTRCTTSSRNVPSAVRSTSPAADRPSVPAVPGPLPQQERSEGASRSPTRTSFSRRCGCAPRRARGRT